MYEEICCITNKGKTTKDEWKNNCDFVPALYIVYENYNNSFSIRYS